MSFDREKINKEIEDLLSSGEDVFDFDFSFADDLLISN